MGPWRQGKLLKGRASWRPWLLSASAWDNLGQGDGGTWACYDVDGYHHEKWNGGGDSFLMNLFV